MLYSQHEVQQYFIGLARQVANDLLAERKDILSIYIYGSVGRGEATPQSDIDLHVVIDTTQAPPEHEDRQINDVTAGIAYHSKNIYQADLEEWLKTDRGFKTIARSESIWEVRDILPLYDPHGLASRFQKQAELVSSLPAVLQARANTSLQRARQTLDEVRTAYDEKNLGRVIVSLFRLTGGDGNSGVAPLLMKAIIQRANLPLTTRRIGIRTKVACEKLSRQDLYQQMLKLLGVHEITSEILDAIQSAFFAAFDYTCELVDEIYSPDIPVYQVLRQTWFNEHFRQNLLCNFREFTDLGHPDGIVAFAVGFSPHLLARGEEYPNAWLRQVSPEKLNLLVEQIARIAHISLPIAINLKKRIEQAEQLYEEITILNK
jgi:predicted nucleotidyltransferase